MVLKMRSNLQKAERDEKTGIRVLRNNTLKLGNAVTHFTGKQIRVGDVVYPFTPGLLRRAPFKTDT